MNATTLIDAPTPIRLTIHDFEVLHRAGALDTYRRTELVDGVIVEMSPMGTRHSVANTRLLFALDDAVRAAGLDLEASLGPTIALPPNDGPQPDLILAYTLEGDGYASPKAVAIVIEVADATLRRDLTKKKVLYSQALIAEYWVADVQNRRVHQFWNVVDGAYTQTRVTPFDEVRSATIPDLVVDASRLP